MLSLCSVLLLSLSLLFLTSAQSCYDQSSQLPSNMVVGTDGPADAETEGFWINHTGLNVRNLTASKAFYGDVLGMRHIITIQYTEHFGLTYMGFSQGGRNGRGFQTGDELKRFKNNSGGLLKLLHFSEPETEVLPSSVRTATMSNLGLVVPDIEVAQKRFEEHGVRIVKNYGIDTLAGDSDVAVSFNVGPESTSDETEVTELVKGLQATDLKSIIFIEDPDGNLLEVVARDGF